MALRPVDSRLVRIGLRTRRHDLEPVAGTTVAMISIASVLRALWLVSIGVSAWSLGYVIGPGRILQGLASGGVATLSRRFGADVRSPASPWLLYIIGSAARFAGAATTGRFGYLGNTASAVSTASGYQQLLSVLSMCAPMAVAVAALQVFRERRPGAKVTLAVLLLVELAVSTASGDKVNFLNAILAVVVPYSAVRYRVPKVTSIAALIVFLLIIVPFNTTYRSAVHGSGANLTSSEAIHAMPSTLKQAVIGRDMGATLSQSLHYLLQRIQEIDNPAIIVQRSPGQIAFLNPSQLVEIPLSAFVPRAIWRGKPIYVPMYQVSQEYYDQPSTVYSAAGITPIGDLYRYGGWLPVIIGMAVLGCTVRLMDNSLDIRKNPHAILLILLLFPSVVVAESGWVAIFSGLPSTLFVWLLAVAVAFRIRPS